MENRKQNALLIALRVMLTRPDLASMMFLQYAIWGVWSVALSGLLVDKFGFEGLGLALIYNALPLMTLFAPITAGQLADRIMPAQRALTLFHLLGGLALFGLAKQTELVPMMVLMLLYALFYAPTLALTNSVAMRHLRDPQVEFGPIRVWGTLGWIAANYILTLVRTQFGSESWGMIDVFALAGGISLFMAIICGFLPNTPPTKERVEPLAFARAFVLFKNPSYLTFFIIAMIVATELPLYYMLTFPFLQAAGPTVGITSENLPTWMTIAQIAEIFTITLLLPVLLPKWGVRKVMLLGIVAWPLRYLAFALTWATYEQTPAMVWLSVAALALHGFCYVFFFVVAFIYTDMVSPRDIRSSAQALINVAILGIGMLVGGFFAGWLKDLFTEDKVTNYTPVFLIPAVITIVAAIVFAALFREESEQPVTG